LIQSKHLFIFNFHPILDVGVKNLRTAHEKTISTYLNITCNNKLQ
jgi:hypothetical protein